MKLTQFERQVLKNQHEILEKLSKDEDERKHHENLKIAYQEGYEYEYFEYGVDGEYYLSVEDCKFVYDVFNMYIDLHYYWSQSDDLKNNFKESDVSFRGFDLNDTNYEAKLYSYAKHVLYKLDIAGDIKKQLGDYHKLNSHGFGPGARGYKSMLEAYKKANKSRMERDLSEPYTVEEMNSILEWYK